MAEPQCPQPNRVWTWSACGRVYAVVLDRSLATLEWFDDVGSMCGYDGGAREQSLDAFTHRGAPLPHVPDNILHEIARCVREAGRQTSLPSIL